MRAASRELAALFAGKALGNPEGAPMAGSQDDGENPIRLNVTPLIDILLIEL